MCRSRAARSRTGRGSGHRQRSRTQQPTERSHCDSGRTQFGRNPLIPEPRSVRNMSYPSFSLILGLTSALSLGAYAVPFRPSSQQQPQAPGSGCACHASYDDALTQIDCSTCSGGSGTPPLIVATSQDAQGCACTKVDDACKDPSAPGVCTGSVDVQITWPGSGPSCLSSVWVQGGTVYPNPTEINSTSQNVSMSVAADCNKSGKAQSDDTVEFKVWCQKPDSQTINTPDFCYGFTLYCAACSGNDG